LRTTAFTELVVHNLTSRNPADTEYECLFFGYSESFVYDGNEHRRWQAAVIRSNLGAAVLGGRISYHFFIAATDKQSGAHINTVQPETPVFPLSIPGLMQGDEAIISAQGLVHVRIQGLTLSPAQQCAW
jgi:hypothetical protein